MKTSAFGKSVAVTLALAMSVAMYGCTTTNETTEATTAAASSSQTTETDMPYLLMKSSVALNFT